MNSLSFRPARDQTFVAADSVTGDADGLGVPVTLSLGKDVVISPPKQPTAKQPLPATTAKRETRRKK